MPHIPNLQRHIDDMTSFFDIKSQGRIASQAEETRRKIAFLLKNKLAHTQLIPTRLYQEQSSHSPKTLDERFHQTLGNDGFEIYHSLLERFPTNLQASITKHIQNDHENTILSAGIPLEDWEIAKMHYHPHVYSSKLEKEQINDILKHASSNKLLANTHSIHSLKSQPPEKIEKILQAISQINFVTLPWNPMVGIEEQLLKQGFSSWNHIRSVEINFHLLTPEEGHYLGGFLSLFPLFQTLKVSDEYESEETCVALSTFCRSCNNFRTLEIHKNTLEKMDEETFSHIIENLPNMNSLNIIHSSSKISPQFAKKIFSRVGNLSYVGFGIIDFDYLPTPILKECFGNLHAIKGLSLSGDTFKDYSSEQLRATFGSLTSLSMLTLYRMNLHTMTEESIDSIFLPLKELKYLLLDSINFGDDPKKVSHIFQYLGNLKMLSLSSSIFPTMNAQEIKDTFTPLTQLEVLNIDWSSLGKLDAEKFGLVMECLPHVQTLNLPSTHIMDWSEAHWEVIGNMKQLQHLILNFINFHKIHQEKIEYMIKNLKQIRYIGVGKGCTKETFSMLITALPNLKKIFVDYEMTQNCSQSLGEFAHKLEGY